MRVNSVSVSSMVDMENTKAQDAGGGKPGKSSPTGRESSQQGPRSISREEVEQAVSQLNSTMKAYSTELHFEVHEKSGEIMVKVMNKENDTVIREIPPEKILDMVAYFKKVLGIIVDKLI